MKKIVWDDFCKVDLRVGAIIKVEEFTDAIKPAYKLKIDFGEKIGLKKSSAQITDLYSKEDLINKQILAVVNLPPNQIGKFSSQCLVTGIYNKDNKVVLVSPDKKISNGLKLF